MRDVVSVPRRRPAGWRSAWPAPTLLLAALLAATACDSDPPLDPGGLRNCAQVTQALELELASIQSCTQANQCGQVLEGTSCGCTRNLVARFDADAGGFFGIVARGRALQCPSTEFGSTCDCPAADGFACVDGRCAWNYL